MSPPVTVLAVLAGKPSGDPPTPIPKKGTRYVAWSGDKNSMLIRRRPSAATLVAIVFTLVIGTSDGSCCRVVAVGRGAPDPVSSVEVTATDGSSVTIAWPALRDRNVAGMGCMWTARGWGRRRRSR